MARKDARPPPVNARKALSAAVFFLCQAFLSFAPKERNADLLNKRNLKF